MSGAKGRSGGHNRKLTSEKIKLGVQHKNRLNEDAPERIAGKLMTLDPLYESEIIVKDLKKKIYDLYAAILMNNGTLSITDSQVFDEWCWISAEWSYYHKICIENGRMLKDPEFPTDPARLTESQWSITEDKLGKRMELLRRELGLSPQSRDSIKKISTGKPVNRWAIK